MNDFKDYRSHTGWCRHSDTSYLRHEAIQLSVAQHSTLYIYVAPVTIRLTTTPCSPAITIYCNLNELPCYP